VLVLTTIVAQWAKAGRIPFDGSTNPQDIGHEVIVIYLAAAEQEKG